LTWGFLAVAGNRLKPRADSWRNNDGAGTPRSQIAEGGWGRDRLQDDARMTRLKSSPSAGPPGRPRIIAAFSVHVLTACGAACALLALIAAVRASWPQMFAWLGVALVIDAVDGTLARRLEVAQVLPRWSGDLLDFVVDFATYVFVPAYAIVAGGLLPPPAAIPLGLLITVTGALYFADRRMKTADSYFCGFPALWNVVAFYLFVLKPAPWLAAIAIIVLAAATFAPIHFVHPVRVPRWRILNLAALALWGALALFALAQNLDPPGWAAALLAIIAVYFVVVGLLRHAD
jgi:phosphatidylcholine synthase